MGGASSEKRKAKIFHGFSSGTSWAALHFFLVLLSLTPFFLILLLCQMDQVSALKALKISRDKEIENLQKDVTSLKADLASKDADHEAQGPGDPIRAWHSLYLHRVEEHQWLSNSVLLPLFFLLFFLLFPFFLLIFSSSFFVFLVEREREKNTKSS